MRDLFKSAPEKFDPCHHVFPRDNISFTFTVMHYPVSLTLSFEFFVCITLLSVFIFVQYIIVLLFKRTNSVSISYWLFLSFGLVATKSVFRVSDKVRFKPVCSSTQAILKFESSLVASLDMTLSNKRIKSGDQIVRRLVRAFFVRKSPKTDISRKGPLSLLR